MTPRKRDRRPDDRPDRRGRRRVDSFVESLLAQKRPKPFAPSEEDAALLRTAIELRGLRDEPAQPSEDFVVSLHRRLRTELADGAPGADAPGTDGAPDASGSTDRRGLLKGAAVAAAAAAVSVAADRAVLRRQLEDRPSPGADAPGNGTGGGPTLMPTPGAWHGVMASTELAEGAARGFDAGIVSGFVQRVDGRLRGVSGTCTHLGCRLALDAARTRLDCPCHLTSFALSGQLLRHQLPVPPPPLPRLAVREVDGQVLVYLPRTVTKITVT